MRPNLHSMLRIGTSAGLTTRSDFPSVLLSSFRFSSRKGTISPWRERNSEAARELQALPSSRTFFWPRNLGGKR